MHLEQQQQQQQEQPKGSAPAAGLAAGVQHVQQTPHFTCPQQTASPPLPPPPPPTCSIHFRLPPSLPPCPCSLS
jgi:hypothetical protein